MIRRRQTRTHARLRISNPKSYTQVKDSVNGIDNSSWTATLPSAKRTLACNRYLTHSLGEHGGQMAPVGVHMG